VGIEIAEHHREAPVERSVCERFSILIQERTVGERQGREMPVAVIEKNGVGLAVLIRVEDGTAILETEPELEAIGQVGVSEWATVDARNLRPAIVDFEFERRAWL